MEQVAAEELEPPVIDGRVDDDSLLDVWLDKVVSRSPRDKETLAIIRHKARTGQTDEQVVAHYRLSSVSALSSRIHYFKGKYADRRRRWLAQRQRTIALLFKIGKWAAAVLALIGLAWWLWYSRQEPRRRSVIPPALRDLPVFGDGTPVSHPAPPDEPPEGGTGD